MGDRSVPLPDRRRNCNRPDHPGNRRTGGGRWLLPVLLPVRVLHLRLLLVLPVPRPLLGLGWVGLARLPDVRTIPLRPRRRGRDPPAAVRERRDHEGPVRSDDARYRTKSIPAIVGLVPRTMGRATCSVRRPEYVGRPRALPRQIKLVIAQG